jgi:hypothetical protein
MSVTDKRCLTRAEQAAILSPEGLFSFYGCEHVFDLLVKSVAAEFLRA